MISSLNNMNVYENVDRYIPTYNHGTILDALNDTLNIDLNAEYFKPKYLNKIFKIFYRKNLTTF